jgi:hypothetical protein
MNHSLWKCKNHESNDINNYDGFLSSLSIGDIEQWSTNGMRELRNFLGLFSQSLTLINKIYFKF